MSLAADYLAALEVLARVFTAYREKTGHTAVLVGGAATAIYTAGQFPSGDFDIVAHDDAAFEAAMLAHGFNKEDQPGFLCRGFHYPLFPQYGFQLVSGSLFDGRSDSSRLVLVTFGRDGDEGVVISPVEDMIADRLSQYAATPADPSRLLQARALFQLNSEIDVQYLRNRIETEGGDPALLELDG
jgi:hypothetical protein